MKLLEFCNTYFLGAAVPVVLALAGIYFAFRLRLFWLLHPIRFLRAVFKKSDPQGVSPLRALSMALAGTLGVGNLVGVSAAIAAGGAGAVFWMWVSATLAMLLKYAETVLALRHRRVDGKGMHGGAMYYILDAFTGRFARVGRMLAFGFALLCLMDAFSMGCVVQVNAMVETVTDVCTVPAWFVGMGIALIVWLVGVGGAERVSRMTQRLVPLMSLGFVIVSVAAIARQADAVPVLLGRICRDAFTEGSVTGGVGGFLLSRALRYGTMRGLLSNEAGCGTSPMAHATTTASDPAAQGCLGIVEVFVDTHVLCTMTALVVLLAQERITVTLDAPMRMTMEAYALLLGPWAEIFLCVAVLCFGLATLFCWSHYASAAASYLIGERRRGWLRGGERVVLLIYCAFCVIGSVCAPQDVWTVADFAIGCMTLLNVCVLCRMHREVERESRALL